MVLVLSIVTSALALSAAATKRYGTADLRLGNKNGYVTNLQTDLKAKGYSPGTIDGAFGDKTRKAVYAFQGDNNLDVDGWVGDKTKEALI